MKTTCRRWWAAGAAAWLVALVAASPFDLEIATAIYRPANPLAQVVERYGEWPAWGLVLLAMVVLSTNRPLTRRLRPLAIALIVLAIVEPLVITQSLKYLWGRVRFRDLMPGYAGYTPFYIPAGPGAGESFPSGHVAMAWICCVCAYWLSGSKAAIACWTAVLAYGLCVMLGRMLAGAHYLTDCIFSAGLDLLLGCVIVGKVRSRFTATGRFRPDGTTP